MVKTKEMHYKCKNLHLSSIENQSSGNRTSRIFLPWPTCRM